MGESGAGVGRVVYIEGESESAGGPGARRRIDVGAWRLCVE